MKSHREIKPILYVLVLFCIVIIKIIIITIPIYNYYLYNCYKIGGVAISSIGNSGLFSKSKDAVNEQVKARYLETITLATYEASMSDNISTNAYLIKVKEVLETAISNNIYDLEGNLEELTTEKHSAENKLVFRGGSDVIARYSAGYRRFLDQHQEMMDSSKIGTRNVMYLKVIE